MTLITNERSYTGEFAEFRDSAGTVKHGLPALAYTGDEFWQLSGAHRSMNSIYPKLTSIWMTSALSAMANGTSGIRKRMVHASCNAMKLRLVSI